MTTMKRVWWLLVMGWAWCGQGATTNAPDVLFSLSDWRLSQVASRKVIITPVSVDGVPDDVLVMDKLLFTTDAEGQFWVSNMVAGLYTAEVQAPPTLTRIVIDVPATNATLRAGNLTTNRTSHASAFVRRLISDGSVTLSPTNGQGDVTISVVGGGGGGISQSDATNAARGVVSGGLTNTTTNAFSGVVASQIVRTPAVVFPIAGGVGSISNFSDHIAIQSHAAGSHVHFDQGLKVYDETGENIRTELKNDGALVLHGNSSSNYGSISFRGGDAPFADEDEEGINIRGGAQTIAYKSGIALGIDTYAAHRSLAGGDTSSSTNLHAFTWGLWSHGYGFASFALGNRVDMTNDYAFLFRASDGIESAEPAYGHGNYSFGVQSQGGVFLGTNVTVFGTLNTYGPNAGTLAIYDSTGTNAVAGWSGSTWYGADTNATYQSQLATNALAIAYTNLWHIKNGALTNSVTNSFQGIALTGANDPVLLRLGADGELSVDTEIAASGFVRANAFIGTVGASNLSGTIFPSLMATNTPASNDWLRATSPSTAAWGPAPSGGSGANLGAGGCSGQSQLNNGTTYYMSFGGGSMSTVGNAAESALAYQCTVTNVAFLMQTGPAAVGTNVTATLQTNGVDTALSVTITGNGTARTGSNTSTGALVPSGSTVRWKVTHTGGSAIATQNYHIKWQELY
jgi:hypothetical protein